MHNSHVEVTRVIDNIKYVLCDNEWKVKSDQYLLIYPRKIIIQSEIEGYPVTCIGKNAFIEQCDVGEIVIPSSITIIEDGAFEYCINLTKIEISSAIKNIGKSVFNFCSKLETIIVDKDNTIYDSRDNCNAIIETKTNTLLYGCNNTTIPCGIVSIEKNAFMGCEGLKELIIPNSVEKIGTGAFNYCSNLEKINLPVKITAIGNYLFNGCEMLKYFEIPNNIKTIEQSAFGLCISLKKIIIPASVTRIEKDAFNYNNFDQIIVDKDNPIYDSRDNCNAIIETKTSTLVFGCKNTVIPPSVTTIKYNAFSGCKGLTSFKLPANVLCLENDIFEACEDLESIVVDKDNPIYDSRDNCNAIIETKTNTLVFGCKNTVIPPSVTSIGECAFLELKNLNSIVIPATVKHVDEIAFYGCEDDDEFNMKEFLIYYEGTQEQAKECFDKRMINSVFFYKEEMPNDTDDNKYWHYVNNKPTMW